MNIHLWLVHQLGCSVLTTRFTLYLSGASGIRRRWIPIMGGEREEGAWWEETVHLWRVGTCRKLSVMKISGQWPHILLVEVSWTECKWLGSGWVCGYAAEETNWVGAVQHWDINLVFTLGGLSDKNAVQLGTWISSLPLSKDGKTTMFIELNLVDAYWLLGISLVFECMNSYGSPCTCSWLLHCCFMEVSSYILLWLSNRQF